jgi:hypothetical protein
MRNVKLGTVKPDNKSKYIKGAVRTEKYLTDMFRIPRVQREKLMIVSVEETGLTYKLINTDLNKVVYDINDWEELGGGGGGIENFTELLDIAPVIQPSQLLLVDDNGVPSFVNMNSVHYGGEWTPETGTQYPTISDYSAPLGFGNTPISIVYIIKKIALSANQRFQYTTGDLAGRIVTTDDYIFYDAAKDEWSYIANCGITPKRIIYVMQGVTSINPDFKLGDRSRPAWSIAQAHAVIEDYLNDIAATDFRIEFIERGTYDLDTLNWVYENMALSIHSELPVVLLNVTLDISSAGLNLLSLSITGDIKITFKKFLISNNYYSKNLTLDVNTITFTDKCTISNSVLHFSVVRMYAEKVILSSVFPITFDLVNIDFRVTELVPYGFMQGVTLVLKNTHSDMSIFNIDVKNIINTTRTRRIQMFNVSHPIAKIKLGTIDTASRVSLELDTCDTSIDLDMMPNYDTTFIILNIAASTVRLNGKYALVGTVDLDENNLPMTNCNLHLNGKFMIEFGNMQSILFSDGSITLDGVFITKNVSGEYYPFVSDGANAIIVVKSMIFHYYGYYGDGKIFHYTSGSDPIKLYVLGNIAVACTDEGLSALGNYTDVLDPSNANGRIRNTYKLTESNAIFI